MMAKKFSPIETVHVKQYRNRVHVMQGGLRSSNISQHKIIQSLIPKLKMSFNIEYLDYWQ